MVCLVFCEGKVVVCRMFDCIVIVRLVMVFIMFFLFLFESVLLVKLDCKFFSICLKLDMIFVFVIIVSLWLRICSLLISFVLCFVVFMIFVIFLI